MGILPPQSPDTVRGGGTSLFSLPGESVADTPHTSNVSLATSITSANPRSSSMKPQLILQQDGLQLRHTTAIVSSLLQKLNISCQQLNSLNASSINKKAKTYVRACEEIKQNYLQMLAIEKGDFRALMEAFHLDLLSPKVTTTISLVREVSTDEEDQLVPRSTRWHRNIQTLEWASSLAVQPIPEDLHQGELRNPFDGADTSLPSHNASFERRDSNIGQDRPDLFSPSTEDMRSWSGDKNAVPYEYDDLRRQFGSYDRDDGCEDELRDGPCCDFEEPREGSAEWQRMYHNVSLAASSIRSEEKFLKGRDE